MRKKHIQSTFTVSRLTNLARSAVIVAACGALGYFLLQQSHAATYATANEAESGTITGNAAAITEVNASAGSAVRFGLDSTAPSVPGNVTAFTGGSSIALRWDGSSAGGTTAIKQYDIYRNGSKIATVTPGWHAEFPEKDGNGYIDSSVTANATYNYQILATDTANRSSQLSTAFSIKQPASANTTATPTVTVDSSAAPALATYMANQATLLRIWYPKISDKYAGTTYDSRVTTFKLVASSTATSDSWATANDTTTMTVSSSAHASTAQQQDMVNTLYMMTGSAINAEHGFQNWVSAGMQWYPYLYMVRAAQVPAVGSLGPYVFGGYAAASLLRYTETTYDTTLMNDLSTAAHNSTYSPTLFMDASNGKTSDMLWTEMTGRKTGVQGKITGLNGMCLDGSFSSSTPNASFRTCTGYDDQGWNTLYDTKNQNFQLVNSSYNCLGIQNAATADGSLVVNGSCGTTPGSQAWQTNANGALVNVASNKCLQGIGGATAVAGVNLEIRACDGSAAQTWVLPAETAPTTPAGLRAFTGGNNIALVWNVPANNPYVRHYNIYRNGVKVGVSRVSTNMGFLRYGTAYTDNNVSNGSTYSYQVQAVDEQGRTSALSSPISATQPSSGQPVPTVSLDSSISSITPELVPWFNNVGIPLLKTWYPKFGNRLGYGSYTYPNSIVIKTMAQADYDAAVPGSAAYVTGGTNAMVINPEQFQDYPDYVTGTIVHESVHIMQYGAYGSTTSRWFTEGMAEYVTAFPLNNYPDQTNTPVGTTNTAYWQLTANSSYVTDWYRPAAFLLNYVNNTYDANYIKNLNVASFNNGVTNAMMQLSDGRNLEQAFGVASGFPSRTGGLVNKSANRCADSDANTGMQDGTKMQIWDCNGAIVQKITVIPNTDGTVFLVDHGKCLTVNNGATANQTPVVLSYCGNATFAASQINMQKWTIKSNGNIVSSVAANKCLETYNAGTANGTALQIYDCNAGAWQQWTTP